MNDQHAHAGHVGHGNYPTGSYGIDPLFGALPDGQDGYEAGHSGQYDVSQWDTGAHQTVGGYDTYAAPEQDQQFPAHGTTGSYDTSGQWDATAWNQAPQQSQFEPAAAFAYDTADQWTAPTFESGSYDATAWNTGIGADTGSIPGVEGVVPQPFAPEQEFIPEYGTEFTAEVTPEPVSEPSHEFAAEATGYEGTGYEPGYESGFEADLRTEIIDLGPESGHGEAESEAPPAPRPGDTASLPAISEADPDHGYDSERELELDPIAAVAPVSPRSVRRSGSAGGGRSRRRTPAKRSALFTIAVPSACVMGVAGIAAASVGSLDGGGDVKKNDTKVTAADVADTAAKTAAANNKMDTQLAALNAEARDFGDRASRTQERIDLKARQEADRKKRVEAAERREALRPKFAVPVKSQGLSTYYGESGVNWMALHTGIDFPVPYGTNVFAASDGTVRTQYNGAYGNMIILTAPDGTETWYCHLSSAKIRSGTVKAGDVIGYAGNSGNSTGPHLHFEVRPGGGSTIDPLQWLRSKGLDPT
ncbi:M23 family metallopeptidase [Streptomyces inusitatus]|uniref:M23 family metallopeptidase n=1 Tax=Streptomyces inusitatus TaxID=68221 RepID=UPI00167DF705|nr:M23 family metallopeptidase [Streptomyces inusitatus]